MWLQRLELEGFRCFHSSALELSPNINVIHGNNGSGKTTILEAVHLLGTGRSFRCSDPDLAIRDGCGSFVLRGTLAQHDGSVARLGLHRTRGHTSIKVNQRVLKAATELTRLLPVSVVTPDAHIEILASPKVRRRWLDVTLFHVKPGFLDLWKRYMRGIKHRNMLLRGNTSDEVLEAWDVEISRAGKELHEARVSILQELNSAGQVLLNSIFPDSNNCVVYQQGWAAGQELDDALRRSRDSDRQMGSTRSGPHRADISFTMNTKPVSARLSRGQLKLWVGALMLAQATVVAKTSGTAPILLIDDLVSDLDVLARRQFLGLLADMGSQLLFTTTDLDNVPIPEHVPSAVFHVKHGEVIQIR